MPTTNVTVPSVLSIPVTYADTDGVNTSSLSTALRIQTSTGTLLNTTFQGVSGAGNTVVATYEWSTAGMVDGTYTPCTSGQQDSAGNTSTAVYHTADNIVISQNGSTPVTGREINLVGLSGFPAPAAEWFEYPDASTAFSGAGMTITNTQTPEPGLIAATVTGPGFTPAGGDQVEVDFLGRDPGPAGDSTQSGVGLGAIDFDNATFSLILDGVIMWNANGSVLAQTNTSAPQQVAGRKHRMRITFNAAVTVATVEFYEDANNNGTYTPMTPASASIAVSPEIADGTTLGFDPGDAGPLTVTRVVVPN